MPLRGIVFGWYHQRNAGDDRFAHCIERWLHDHELTFLPHTQPPPLDVLRRADYAILGCGSIADRVHGVFSGMKRWIAAARIPVYGVGLTVSPYPELLAELREVVAAGGSLWMRDRQSAEAVGIGRNVVAGPDITWLFPRTFERNVAADSVAYNFRPWPKRQWDPAAWGRELEKLGRPLVPWPLCFGKDDDRLVLSQIAGREVADIEYDPVVPAQTSLVVAMRFHAIIFALQTGTPVVPVSNSKKLQWMLEQIGLEELAVPVEQPAGLADAVDRAKDWCSPAKLTDLRARLYSEAWTIADRLKDEIEAAVAKRRVLHRRLPARVKNKLSRIIKSL